MNPRMVRSDYDVGRIEHRNKGSFSMLKSITTAIIIATLATSVVQAKQVDTDAPKAERVVAQKLAKAEKPYFWLVLGVGY
jgi:hypothetical protein